MSMIHKTMMNVPVGLELESTFALWRHLEERAAPDFVTTVWRGQRDKRENPGLGSSSNSEIK